MKTVHIKLKFAKLVSRKTRTLNYVYILNQKIIQYSCTPFNNLLILNEE